MSTLSDMQTTVALAGGDVTIQALGTTKALVLTARMARVVAGAGSGLEDLPTSRAEVMSMHIGKVVQGIVDRLDEKSLVDVVHYALRHSLVVPSHSSDADFVQWFNGRFARRLDEVLELLTAVIKFNYGPPMEWLGKTLGRLGDTPSAPPSAPGLKVAGKQS